MQAAVALRVKPKFTALRCIEVFPPALPGQTTFLTLGRSYIPLKVFWNESTGYWAQLLADDRQRRTYSMRCFEPVIA